jgi:hypothetical protein
MNTGLSIRFSKLCVQSDRAYAHWTTIRVVGRVLDALHMEGDPRAPENGQAIESFDDILRVIIESSVTDKKTEPSGRQVVAMRARWLVAGQSQAD